MSNIEESLRAETFAPGIPLELLNGETFQFERPVFRGIYPAFGEGGKIEQRPSIHFGADWENCINSVEDTAKTKEGNIWPYVAWLADRMLTHRNYRPEIRDHYRDILYFSVSDERTKSIWYEIYNIALGIDPKGRSSAG